MDTKHIIAGIAVGATLLVGGGAVDMVPVSLPTEQWFQYHVSDYKGTWTETTATGTVEHIQEVPNFSDDNGDGLISYSFATNKKGKKVYTQIPEVAYEKLGKKDGGKFNADYPSIDKITVAEAILEGLMPNIAEASIARLSTGTWAGGASASSQTIPITISAGSNAVLVVTWRSTQTGNHDLTSISYNGNSMGTVKQSVTPPGNALETYTLFLGTTDGSAHNIVINYSPNDSGVGTWTSYSGVDQTGFDNTNYTTGTSNGNITKSVTVNTTGSWITSVTADADVGNFTAISGLVSFGASPGNAFDSNGATSTGSQSATINRPSGTRDWLWSIFVLKASAAPINTTNNGCHGELHGQWYCQQ